MLYIRGRSFGQGAVEVRDSHGDADPGTVVKAFRGPFAYLRAFIWRCEHAKQYDGR